MNKLYYNIGTVRRLHISSRVLFITLLSRSIAFNSFCIWNVLNQPRLEYYQVTNWLCAFQNQYMNLLEEQHSCAQSKNKTVTLACQQCGCVTPRTKTSNELGNSSAVCLSELRTRSLNPIALLRLNSYESDSSTSS